MKFLLEDDSDAARFISIAFGTEPLLSTVKDLLRTASGATTTTSPHRHLSATSIDLLTQHRVISLIPSHWTTDLSDPEYSGKLTTLGIDRLRLEAVMRSVVEQLATESVECRVLKGLATARLDYSEPGLRDTGDVDLLVRPTDIHRAISLLEEIGCVVEAGMDYDPDLAKGTVLKHPENIQIDMHTRLFIFKPQDIELLLAKPDSLGFANACALNRELRLLHASSHLAYTPPGARRLSGVADITAIVDKGALDWDSIRHTARELDIESMSGVGLRVEALLMGRDHAHLESWARPTQLETLAFVRHKRSLALEKLLLLATLKGTRAKARYVRNAVLPSSEAAAVRGGYAAYYSKVLPRSLGGQGGKENWR